MAKLDSAGSIRGAVGPVVYKKLKNGMQTVQTKSAPRQTKNTRLAAADFATSSRIARQVRMAVRPITAGFETKYMGSRLSGLLFSALCSGSQQPAGKRQINQPGLDRLAGFQFNPDTPFEQYCLLEPQLHYDPDQGMSISIPEFNDRESFVLVPGATNCELVFLVVVHDYNSMVHDLAGSLTYEQVYRLPIPMRGEQHPASTFSLPPQTPETLITVAAAVFYYKTDALMGSIGLNNVRLHPCELLGAVWVS